MITILLDYTIKLNVGTLTQVFSDDPMMFTHSIYSISWYSGDIGQANHGGERTWTNFKAKYRRIRRRKTGCYQ